MAPLERDLVLSRVQVSLAFSLVLLVERPLWAGVC